MPSVPRRDVVDESVVGVYHLYGRAARQEFLLGLNPSTGWEYGHRKDLFDTRLELLESVYAVECLESSLLDNHFHLLLRNRPDIVRKWTDRQVVERWLLLNRAEVELRTPPKETDINALVKNAAEVAKIRQRLSSISWFMAYLREPLARVFNAEDGRSGHFWERFGCRRKDDELSLLACCLYIALNLIRAGMAKSIETSKHSSVWARLRDLRSGDPNRPHSGHLAATHVDGDGFAGEAAGRRPSDKGYLRITFAEFLELLAYLIDLELAAQRGEQRREWPPILEQLGVDRARWEGTVRLTSRRFSKELDRMASIRATAPRYAAAHEASAGSGY